MPKGKNPAKWLCDDCVEDCSAAGDQRHTRKRQICSYHKNADDVMVEQLVVSLDKCAAAERAAAEAAPETDGFDKPSEDCHWEGEVAERARDYARRILRAAKVADLSGCPLCQS